MKTRLKKNLLVFKGLDEISVFVIEKWLEISHNAIEKNGRFAVALSGGKTPVPLYNKLVELKELFQWDKTDIFLVDERFVDFNNSESNFRMIKEALLDHIDVPVENIHPVPIEEDAELSAVQYEKDMISFLNLANGGIPRLDLVLLGVGEDGHIASLFPGTSALNETGKLAIATMPPDISKRERITITLPVINNADNIFFIAIGTNKAIIIKEIIEGDNRLLPAAIVNPEEGKSVFLIDEGAGSLLSQYQK